jgi:hypothetical protein
LIAGQNAMLLTGDPTWLDLHRSQGDLLWSLRRDEGGSVRVPFRYGDQGWFDYRTMEPRHHVHLYFMSRDPEDWARLEARFPDREGWTTAPPRFGKAGHFWPERWFGYMVGENPDFPAQVLGDTITCMQQRLDKIDRDDGSKIEEWDVHHWQDLNPVVPEGLIQMAMGTPAAIYHGGLLHASVRYFDPEAGRPGLPDDVAALVAEITPEGVTVTLVNTNPLVARDVVVQAGGFGEHQFTEVRDAEAPASPAVAVNDRYLRVKLAPWSQARLRVTMDRYVNRPTYDFPWMRDDEV